MNEQRLWQRLLICLQLLRKTLTFLITNKGSNEATDQPEYNKEYDLYTQVTEGSLDCFPCAKPRAAPSMPEIIDCLKSNIRTVEQYNVEYICRTLKVGHS